MIILSRVKKLKDGRRALSHKVHLMYSNNSQERYYDLSIVLYLGGCYSGNVIWEDNLSRYQEMIFDVASHEFRMYFELSEEIPNLDDERFYSLLEAVNRPL